MDVFGIDVSFLGRIDVLQDQGSERPRMFRRHFAPATFSSTLRYQPVSEPVFKDLKLV